MAGNVITALDTIHQYIVWGVDHFDADSLELVDPPSAKVREAMDNMRQGPCLSCSVLNFYFALQHVHDHM